MIDPFYHRLPEGNLKLDVAARSRRRWQLSRRQYVRRDYFTH